MSSDDLRRAASRAPQLLVPGAIGILIVLYIISLGVGGCHDLCSDDDYDPGLPLEVNCEDGIDNDEDGDIDCADPDCDYIAPCGLEQDNCNDGVDNDGDGLVDCADPDCDGIAPCGSEEANCDDGVDNDGDGLIDCADPDCAGFPGC